MDCGLHEWKTSQTIANGQECDPTDVRREPQFLGQILQGRYEEIVSLARRKIAIHTVLRGSMNDIIRYIQL